MHHVQIKISCIYSQQTFCHGRSLFLSALLYSVSVHSKIDSNYMQSLCCSLAAPGLRSYKPKLEAHLESQKMQLALEKFGTIQMQKKKTQPTSSIL